MVPGGHGEAGPLPPLQGITNPTTNPTRAARTVAPSAAKPYRELRVLTAITTPLPAIKVGFEFTFALTVARQLGRA